MDSGTLSDPKVDEFLRENFTLVRLEKEADPDTFESLKVTSFPTTIVLRGDGEEVARFDGYLDATELLEKLGPLATSN